MPKKDDKTMNKPDPIEEVSDGDLEGIEKLKKLLSKRQGEKIGKPEHTQSPYRVGLGNERGTAERTSFKDPSNWSKDKPLERVGRRAFGSKPTASGRIHSDAMPDRKDLPSSGGKTPIETGTNKTPTTNIRDTESGNPSSRIDNKKETENLNAQGTRTKPKQNLRGRLQNISEQTQNRARKLSDDAREKLGKERKHTTEGKTKPWHEDPKIGQEPTGVLSSQQTRREAGISAPRFRARDSMQSSPINQRQFNNLSRNRKKDGFGYGDLNVANITPETAYNDETYIGRPEKPAHKTDDKSDKQETYILNAQNKKHKMNKITKTKVGDDIHFFVNGKEDRGIVAKMTNSFVTIFKSDGIFYEIPLNDTFFVKDILVNKSWNDMNEYERTEILQKAHITSPLYLLKTWEQLPKELQDVIKSDVEQGAYGGISTATTIDADKDYEGQTHEGERKEQFEYEDKKPEVSKEAMMSGDAGVNNTVNVNGKKEKIKAGEFVYTEHTEYKTKKFDANPNSFGIKYMSKDEKEEWLKKDSVDGNQSGTPKVEGQSHGQQSTSARIRDSGSGIKARDSRNPKGSVDTSQARFTPSGSGKQPEGTGADKPSKGEHNLSFTNPEYRAQEDDEEYKVQESSGSGSPKDLKIKALKLNLKKFD